MVDEPTQTLETSTDDALSLGNVPLDEPGLSVEGDGNPQDAQGLPKEYKSYSDINWELIPEEVREDVLAGVKKMHGGLTRDHQELSDLRKKLPDVERKAQALDWLWAQPWFKQAYERSQNPSQAAETPEPSGLADQLGDDTSRAVQSEISRAVQQALAPYEERMQGLQQRVVAFDTEREMNQLAAEAAQKGWPDPRTRIGEIEASLRNGAGSLRAAYKDAVFDELPDVIERRAVEQYQQKLKKKADITLPPGGQPSGSHLTETFKGPNCVQDAVRATLRSMSAKR